MEGRAFPSPWIVEENNDPCLIVSDANGQKLAYVYFEEDHPGRQSTAKLLTRAEARRIAVNLARLPDLLRLQPHWRQGLRSTPSIFFLLSHLVAVHPPELGIIQRLKHIADQIPLSSRLQILATDPRSGCIF